MSVSVIVGLMCDSVASSLSPQRKSLLGLHKNQRERERGSEREREKESEQERERERQKGHAQTLDSPSHNTVREVERGGH